jgi:hypothetical protein
MDRIVLVNYDSFTMKLLKNNQHFKKWMSLALRYMEITNIEAEGKIVTYHNKYDGNNLLVLLVQLILMRS